MLNTLTITGENALQVKVFAYYADKALNKLYLPDFDAKVKLDYNGWDNVEFTLEIPSGVQYSAKEFLSLQFKLWARKELLGKLYKFIIYSKDKQNITKILFKVDLLNKEL